MHERMLHGIFQDQDADGQPELFADLGGKIEHPLPLLVWLLTGTHAQRLSHGLPSQRVGVQRWPPGDELAATFGLVTIPVKRYTATEGKDVRFRLLHSSCMTPIQNKRYCPQHEQIVDWNDVVRGYEYAKGKFVPVSDEELDGVPLDTAGTVNVTSFADLHEIDPIYYEKSYYLDRKSVV